MLNKVQHAISSPYKARAILEAYQFYFKKSARLEEELTCYGNQLPNRLSFRDACDMYETLDESNRALYKTYVVPKIRTALELDESCSDLEVMKAGTEFYNFLNSYKNN